MLLRALLVLEPKESNMFVRNACLCLILSSIPASEGLKTGTAASKALLVGVTTGSGAEGGSEIITIDPRDGKAEKVGRLVPPKGHKLVQAQDLTWSTDSKHLIVTQLGFDDKDEPHTWIDWVEPSSLKIERSTAPTPGVLDSFCWDGQGRLLATLGNARPMKLLAIDPETGARTETATLEARLWVRSLVWKAAGSELWALHTRTTELDYDALVKLSPKDGAVLQIVKLDMREMATALALDRRGEFVVAGDKGGWFHLDAATGKTERSKAELEFRVNGLVVGR
ncbi:MAG: hypothetical protein JNL28_15090 [Planctomycetes bacterium]|nr:hypothetical protein [Planctomycetota bacterium]